LAQEKKALPQEVSTEKVTLWKNDSASLWTAGLDSDGKPLDAGQLEKALATEKINALITGNISVLDEYLAVSVEFRLYPGGQLAGTAMEVGRITHIADIARVLAFDLMPGVESSRPATLIFAFDENMPKDFIVSVDSNTFSAAAIPGRYPVAAGTHQVSFEAAGYKTESLSMDFASNTTYRLGVRVEKETVDAISLNLKNESKGFFLINGVTTASPAEDVSVGNTAVLGRFDPETTPGEKANPGYFVVPPEAATSSARSWTVDPFQKDVSANIEKSRKRLYFSYTMLMISVPVLFVTLGEFNKYSYADQSGRANTSALAQNWSIANYVAIGATAALGANFIWQLVRYMLSAGPVSPVVATPLQTVPLQSAPLTSEPPLDELPLNEGGK
jgi:hypothetical protein